MTIDEQLRECGNCRFWTPTYRGVVGECEIDMETKLRHDCCPSWELKKKS